MARKKKHPEHENHERWLVSYADFITLLFAFFVVMFASSNADKGKAEAVSNSVKQALENGGFTTLVASVLGGTSADVGQGNAQMKGPGGAKNNLQDGGPQAQDTAAKIKTEGLGKGEGGTLVELKPAMEFLAKELAEEIAGGQMEITMQARGLVVSFREAAFFSSGRAEVSEDYINSVAKVAEVIQRLPNPVRMEGHTDSIPIHNSRFSSNWELSAARSIAMLELFASRFAIPRDKLSIAAYADNAPVGDNESAEGQARNRRVDIILLNEVGMQAEPQMAENAPSPHGEDPPPDQHQSKGGH
ncbi:MAG: OmpA family protein [bacterium]|nr:OmpA family protein [bacterium]